jgi:hypothetical protein
VSPEGINGIWKGKTAQAGETTPTTNVSTGYFELGVVSNRVDELRVQAMLPEPCPGNLTAFFALSGAIAANGTFASANASLNSRLSVSIAGAFTESGQASGSITITFADPNGCSSTMSTTWTATKSSSTQQ